MVQLQHKDCFCSWWQAQGWNWGRTMTPPTHPSFLTVRGEGIHGCVSSMSSFLTASVLGTWVLFPGARLQAQEGKNPSFSWILQEQCICFFTLYWFLPCFVGILYLVLLCKALDEMGFIPGNKKHLLVLSWFREVQGLQTSCSWSGSWGITCYGFLTLVVCSSLSHQHLLELLQQRITSLHFEDFFPAEISILLRVVESVRVTIW